MAFLDVCHLFFDPAVTIEDGTSIFGKEWRMTLQHVLHQPGLKASYTSRLSTEHDLWVFLLWATEDSRTQFYHQTTGFGFLSQRMAKAPHVFFFGDDLYEELDKTTDWTIDVEYSELQEQQFTELLSCYDFLARQEGKAVKDLYRGNDFDNACIGLVKIDMCAEKDPSSRLKGEQFSVEIKKHNPILYPNCLSVDLPVDITDLTTKQPWEYGVLEYDKSEYSNTAYPMDLNFRPMAALGSAGKFLPESDRQRSVELERDNKYTMCIVSLPVGSTNSTHNNESAYEGLREKIGLQDGAQGLLELSTLRATGSQAKKGSIRFLCVWNTVFDFEQWQNNFIIPHQCSLDLLWPSTEIGLPNLNWEDMPLTADNQSWQKVEKILEIVEFGFEQSLSQAEKEAFQQRVYGLTNTMSSCWSGDIDARPVVYAEDPVWTQSEGVPSSCLLFLAWDGIAQREAWLRNFMANGFLWTGYLAHTLGLISSHVRSGTYSLRKAYEVRATHDSRPNIGDGSDVDDDSDRDMGF